jgi:hypothetical protein
VMMTASTATPAAGNANFFTRATMTSTQNPLASIGAAPERCY